MAPSQGTAFAPLTAQQMSQWRVAQHEAVEQRWLIGRGRFFIVAPVALLTLVLLLSRTGYPAWRIACLALSFVLMLVMSALDVRSARLGTLSHRGITERRGIFMAVLALVCCWLSGGIHSPLLVLPMAGHAITANRALWTASNVRPLAMTIGGVLVLAVLPARWAGPLVPEPWFTLLALFTFLLGIGLLTDLMSLHARTLDHSMSELYQARDEVATQALARARELEQVSAQLSHELKNPLGAVKTLVQLSERRTSDPVSKKQLQVVESEVEHMGAILQEHLTFARPLTALTLGRADVGELVEGVVSALSARAAAAGVSLVRSGSAEALVDHQRLKAALINLVANAIEASPSGTQVTVEILRRPAEVAIAVRDRGRGMPREVLERIGTPFFTTREHGTGLGVTLAKATFAQHGGRLEYQSAPGEGTTALGVLPLGPGGGAARPS